MLIFPVLHSKVKKIARILEKKIAQPCDLTNSAFRSSGCEEEHPSVKPKIKCFPYLSTTFLPKEIFDRPGVAGAVLQTAS